MSSAPCCAVCHVNDAWALCSCALPVLPICESCFGNGHRTHLNWPFNPMRQAAPEPQAPIFVSNVSCETCGSPAESVCICQIPCKGFCNSHIRSHTSKDQSLPHYQLPSEHLGNVPSDEESLRAFRAKQILIDNVKAKLLTAKDEIQRKRAEAESAFADLHQLLDTVQFEQMTELDDAIAKVDDKIQRFIRNTTELRVNANYVPTTLLEHLVATENHESLASRTFEFIRCTFNSLPELKRQIEGLVTTRANFSLFGDPPVIVPAQNEERKDFGAIFPMITSTRLVLFKPPSCTEYKEKTFNPRYRPQVDELTRIVIISPTQIFCVGGEEKNSAYTVNVQNAHISKEHEMTQKRAAPGVVFFPPWVFVFGGTFRSTDHQSAERYLPTQKSWQPRGQMLNGRACFTPCVLVDRIYLFGGGPPRPEYYVEGTNTCYYLPFNMPSNGPAITFISRGDVVFISGRGLYRYRNNGLEDLKKVCEFEANSHIAPVTIGNSIYFSDCTIDTTLVSLDLNTLQWRKLAEYQAGRF